MLGQLAQRIREYRAATGELPTGAAEGNPRTVVLADDCVVQ